MTRFAIDVNELCCACGEPRALDRLTLRVPTGTVFGLPGPNGAGKTRNNDSGAPGPRGGDLPPLVAFQKECVKAPR